MELGCQWASRSLDFSVELLNAGEIRPGLVAHHWLVRGTNTGPGADGSEPTGQTMTLQGASIIQLEGEKIRSDKCYFDRKALDKQFQPNWRFWTEGMG
jgi:hypothetical protein